MPITETWWFELLKAVCPIFLGLVGAYLGYLFAVKKDRINKKRELAISYLIETYLMFGDYWATNQTIDKNFVKIVNQLQLLGSNSQVKLCKNVLRQIENSEKIELEQLMKDLRNSLREELNLPQAEEPIYPKLY